MCDIHGPISAQSQTNVAFSKDGQVDRGGGRHSSVGRRLLSLRSGSEETGSGEEPAVRVSKPTYLQAPVILLNGDTNHSEHKGVAGD